MSNSFNDNYTKMLTSRMSDFEERIYDIEDGISSLEENEDAIIDYLKDIRCSMPLGLALRRYLCGKFGSWSEAEKAFIFDLGVDMKVKVSDYRSEDYDICNDDVKEYTELFMYIADKYNKDSDICETINKAEARRLLKVTTVCQRGKMFLIGFALHMDTDEMNKFLSDVLAEQTYNYRDPYEIIAFYCQSREDINNYGEYCRLKTEYDRRSAGIKAEGASKNEYTLFARFELNSRITTEEELFDFLLSNAVEFNSFSKTAYNEFMEMFSEALERSEIQALSNDEYLNDAEIRTAEQRREREDRINRAIGLESVTNTEQLAKRMWQFIPRATTKKEMGGGKHVISNDFIPIYNGESGQKSKKVQTTTLPKDITANLLMKDRLDDLIQKKKPVERKDLVFLKFYLYSLELIEEYDENKAYSSSDYLIFLEECNNMLLRCGMSRLYPANRFENLILISLVSSRPFEMFGDIIEYSFFNEPEAE